METEITERPALKKERTPAGNIPAMSSPVITGRRKTMVVIRMWLSVAFFIYRKFPNPVHFYRILSKVIGLKNRLTINNSIQKLAEVDGRFFFNINNNGWPAKHFNRLFEIEARIIVRKDVSNFENLRMVLIGLTKKCPLKCEHCYEWNELNKKETLSLSDHRKILQKFQDAGISQFQFGGGEPMTRVHDLIELLSTAKKSADFWISTSGFNFTEENAFKLKKAGLTGVAISLDHFDPALHNVFRGYKDAYHWVEQAAVNAHKAKLVTAFSICVTRSFCTESNLLQYMLLAKKLGASFVQFLEPRSVGNYEGKDVSLHPEHEKMLEDFYFKMNNDPAFRDMPIVIYHGYRQRLIGCAGAGSRYLYVDTDGYMTSCPFCRNKTTHVLDEGVEESILKMKAEGCGKFEILT
ncbi:MAG: radical protein [Bacteroidetes bacterium]|nr:radical protein [Bacteroidota bacterium]